MKPRIFIGSSEEGKEIAEAIQFNLRDIAQITPWFQGCFRVSDYILESIIKASVTFDFAIFILSPDDKITRRGEDKSAPRDNNIFEAGLFIGTLGKDRCFIVVPNDIRNMHLPSDLDGFILSKYEHDRLDNNWNAAVGPTCYEIKRAIEKQGFRQEANRLVFKDSGKNVEIKKGNIRGIVDQSFIDPHNLGCSINEGFKFIAQTFTAGISGKLVGINVNIRSKRSMNPNLNFRKYKLMVQIYNVRDSYPDSMLTEILMNSDESPIGNFIEIPEPIVQKAGNEYAIVACYPNGPPPGGGQWIGNWYGATGNHYLRGELLSSSDAKLWFFSGINDNDVHFRTYVEPENL